MRRKNYSYHYLLISFLILTVTLANLAKANTITKEQCEGWAFDHKALVGPDSNQFATQYCWAHAIAPLLEEQICKLQPALCGLMVSRAMVAALSNLTLPVLADRNHEEKVEVALKNILKVGYICLELDVLNPYDLYYWDRADQKILQALAAIYDYLDESSTNSMCTSKLTAIQEKIAFVESFLFKSHPGSGDPLSIGQLTGFYKRAQNSAAKRVEKKLQEFPAKREFIQRVLLSECKEEKRIYFSKIGFNLAPISSNTFYKKSGNKRKFPLSAPDLHEQREAVSLARASGNSFVVSLCFSDLLLNLFKDPQEYTKARQLFSFNDDNCAGHAMVVTGIRFDSSNNRCEFYIKNSHGSDAIIASKWYPAEDILKSTIGVSYLKQK
ncbi:MAG: hypothetical protein HQK50_15655 [Oligoflexia bacterium]|nr:hypothetical protein [Oligoflexia bacterium]MBF0367009.1 hypothetical protein [Oligoflexia bacterium]